MRAATAIASLACCSCSAVRRISASAEEIRSEAGELIEHGKAVGDPVVVEGAERISGLAAGIQQSVTGVKDVVPAWMTMVEWAAIAAIAVAVAVILWQTGLGRAIRAILGWIPSGTSRQAELAVDSLDPRRKESSREYIAAQRASDPLFDRAYAKAATRRRRR